MPEYEHNKLYVYDATSQTFDPYVPPAGAREALEQLISAFQSQGLIVSRKSFDAVERARATLSAPHHERSGVQIVDDLAPAAWLVDGPLPLDSSEVFLVHEKALAAFNDWGKRITPLYALSSTDPLPAKPARASTKTKETK